MEFLDITGLKTALENLKNKFISTSGGEITGPLNITNTQLTLTNSNLIFTASSGYESNRAVAISSSKGQVVLMPNGKVNLAGDEEGVSGIGVTVQGPSTSVKIFDGGILRNDLYNSEDGASKVFAANGSLLDVQSLSAEDYVYPNREIELPEDTYDFQPATSGAVIYLQYKLYFALKNNRVNDDSNILGGKRRNTYAISYHISANSTQSFDALVVLESSYYSSSSWDSTSKTFINNFLINDTSTNRYRFKKGLVVKYNNKYLVSGYDRTTLYECDNLLDAYLFRNSQL